MNPWFWILVAPLAWSLGLCAIAYARDPDWRILPCGVLLLAIGLLEWIAAPTTIGTAIAEIPLDQQLAALAGVFVLNGLAAIVCWFGTKSIVERNQAERRRWLNLDALRGLSRHAVVGRAKTAPAFREILEIGCAQLGCEIGVVSRIEGEAWEIRACHGPLEFECGDRIALRATFCESTVTRKCTTTWAVPEPSPPGNPLRFKRYLGVPLWIEGEIVGTVCFARREKRGAPFSMAEIQSASLVAQVATAQLANIESAAPETAPPLAREADPTPAAKPGTSDRFAVDPAIRSKQAALKSLAGAEGQLQLQLDTEGAEIAMPEEEFGTLLSALLFHAARHSREAGFAERFMLESSRIEGDADTASAASFVTISIHAAGSQPSALEFKRLFEEEEPMSSEPPSLSQIRALLQERGGDLSGQSAAGLGLTLTAFIPLPVEDSESKVLRYYPLP